MDRINFTIKGAKEMENLLKALGPRVARKVGDRALRAAARPIVAEAKRLVRVDSGDLKRSIAARADRKANARQDSRGLIIGSVGEGYRAHFLEFGTSHHPAYPFLRPAMDSRAGEALDALGRVLGDGIDREAQALDKVKV